MENKDRLRRTESLRSLPSTPSDRWDDNSERLSVSKLVARYQSETNLRSHESEERQETSSPSKNKLESLRRIFEMKMIQTPNFPPRRCNSMGNLPQIKNIDIDIRMLKACFEIPVDKSNSQCASVVSKVKTGQSNNVINDGSPRTPSSKPSQCRMSEGRYSIGTCPEQLEEAVNRSFGITDPESTVNKEPTLNQKLLPEEGEPQQWPTMLKEELDEERLLYPRTPKRNNQPLLEQEVISVRERSAIYLSKSEAGPSVKYTISSQDSTPRAAKEFQQIEFQSPSREFCAACRGPVYHMERLATDRLVFHHSCFRCKRCRLKLNLLNFVPVQDEFYCRAHYDRQCKAKHNYIEDFDLNHCEELLLSKNTNCSQTENNLQIEENGKLEDAKGKLDLVPNAVQPNLEGVGRISEPAERSKSGMKNSTRSVPIAKLRISWPPPKTAD